MVRTPSPKHVFMSYSRRDEAVMQRILKFFRGQGIKVWLDNEKLVPGTPVWEMEIENAIKGATAIVVICSPDSKNSEWVRREITLAERYLKRIFPVLVRGDEDSSISIRLSTRQYVDIRQNEEVGIRSLSTAVSIYLEELEEREREEQKRKIAEKRARKEVEEQARKGREEQEKKVAEEKARKAMEERERQAAEDRARKMAEEKDRKEKEERKREVPPTKPVSQASGPTYEPQKQSAGRTAREASPKGGGPTKPNWLPYGIGGVVVLVLACLFFSVTYLYKNFLVPAEPTQREPAPLIIPTDTLSPQATETDVPVELGVGSKMISEVDGMVIVYVPAGGFEIGSEDGDDDEKPAHTVSLDAYWIDQTEVTNTMFAKFVNDTDYITDAEQAGESFVFESGTGKQKSGADWQHPLGPDSSISAIMEHPVVHVSWDDANAYCEWAGRRLPTEAEWEKAASWDENNRNKNVYPWGDEYDCQIVNYANCEGGTTAVGSYESGKSPYGAYDMAGNVWEWVADWYDSEYYAISPASNPVGPDSGINRVLRGGSWLNSGIFVRSADRNGDSTGSSNVVGFRCSRYEFP